MWRRTAYFTLQRLIGSNVARYYQEFFQLERESTQKLAALQQERLNRILNHAVTEVPFYRERISQRKGVELCDFPILTRELVRSNFQELMTASLREEYQLQGKKRAAYSWLKVQTGGSTGVPTTVIHDPGFRDRGRAARLYSQSLCGFPFGVPYYRLWGSMKEISQMKASLSGRITSALARETLFNAFDLNPDSLDGYIQQINATGHQYMMAYVEAAYQLARYIEKTGASVHPLKAVMACAGTVTDDFRETISRVFGCRVHNKYGSRECTDLACECEAGGFHIYMPNVFLEVVDAVGNPVPTGETGRLLITILSNESFPLIRYEIGDMGALSGKICPCGRNFPLLERVEGRSVEFLFNNSGGFVTPNFIIHLTGVEHNPGVIRRFQMIQTSLLDFTLSVELEPGVSASQFAQFCEPLIRDLKAVLGEQSNIEIQKVDKIPPSASGKHLYTINRIATNSS